MTEKVHSAAPSGEALRGTNADAAPTKGRWLVFNIGCIECGVSSNVVGIFPTEESAELAAAACEKELGWRQGGQNHFEVFDLDAEQADEYHAALAKARSE